MQQETPRLLGIQSLRAIAAFLVLFQHVTFYVVLAKSLDYQPYLRIDFGAIGVALFFVISGFVMAHCMKEGSLFLVNRAVRIYPAFWISIIFSYILLSSFSDWSFDFKSFFLIPTIHANNSYKIPYWTLIYEVFFYSMVYLISLVTKTAEKITLLCCLWLLAIFAFNAYHLVKINLPGVLILFSPINIYFITGFLFAFHEDLFQKSKVTLMLLLSLVLWGISLNLADVTHNILVSFAFGILVVCSKTKLTHPILVKLGNYSYGIYLLHVPIALLAIHIIQKNDPTLSLRYLWPLCFLITVVFSVCFGKLENKIHLYLKAIIKGKKSIIFFRKYILKNAT